MHKAIGVIGGIEIVAGGIQTVNPLYVPQWAGGIFIILGLVTIWWAIGRPFPHVLKKTLKLGQWRIPITDFYRLAEESGWDFVDSERTGHILDFPEGLRQAGIDGTIMFWGRKFPEYVPMFVDDEPLLEIPSDYWKLSEIAASSIIDTSLKTTSSDVIKVNNSDTRTHSPDYSGGRKGHYADLHVNREQAKKWLSNESQHYQGRSNAR